MNNKNRKQNLADSQMDETHIDKDPPTIYYSKATMYEREPNKDIYCAMDKSDSDSSKTFVAMNYDEIEGYLQDNLHIYEIIRSDKPRFPYFDIECSYQKLQKHEEWAGITDMNEIAEKFVNQFKGLMKDFKDDEGFNVEHDLVVMNSSSNAKFSLHIIDRSLVLANKEDCAKYHSVFIDNYIGQENPHIFHLVDKCVYDTDRMFRMVNQSKISDTTRVLKITSDHDLMESLVTKVDKEPITIPKKGLWKKVIVNNVIVPIKTDLDDDEESEVTLLVSKLSDKRFDEYNEWCQTTWCLHACGMSSDDIHFESQVRCPEKYEYGSTDTIIKQYDHTKSKFSIHTLRAWAKKDSGYEVERHVERKQAVQPINKEEHFQYIQLLKKYDHKNFDNGLGFDEFKKDVSLCVSHIMGGQSMFSMYTNESNQFDLTKNLPTLTFSKTVDGDEASRKSFTLQNYMSLNKLEFPLFNKIVFKPNIKDVLPNELNTWAGFKAQEVHNVDMTIIKVFTDHIFTVWANGNQEYYKYLLSWIAQVIKTPHKKTEIALVLQGGQGTGKTLPLDILLEHVFGMNIGMSASGLGSLTQRFNGSTMGKIFCKCDELTDVGESFSNAFDKMKSLITDRFIQIEKKGLEHINIENHINIATTTNHLHSIKVEGDDRRYAIFKVGESRKQDTDYFASFMDILDNQNAGNHLFTYFKNYPIEDMVNLRKIPMTNIKEDMMDNSRSSTERFIKCMDEDFEPALLYNWVGKDGERAITVNRLYEYYSMWCTTNGEKNKWSNKIFTSELKSKGLYKTKDKNQIDGVQNRYYQF
jgi:hypothetical protein